MAGLQADGVNKNHHTQYVNMFRQAQTMVQSAKQHSHEKYRRHSELEAEETEVADKVAKTDDREQHQKRILCQEIKQDLPQRDFGNYRSKSRISAHTLQPGAKFSIEKIGDRRQITL